MMRITVFLTYGMSLSKWAESGVLHRELALYEQFVAKGGHVTFVSWGGRSDEEHVGHCSGMSVACNVFRLPPRLYAKLLPVLHLGVFRRSDLFKTNQMYGAEVALACARFWGKPLVARCGFMLSEFRRMQKTTGEYELARRVERQAFSHARKGIVTTREMQDYLVDEYGIERDRVEVLPNYVIDSFFSASRKPDNQKPLILSIGRLNEQKNFESLIRACAGLDVHLRIIGQGDLHDSLAALARAVGVEVVFAGQVDHEQLPDEIARADVYAQVSLYEGHPKSLLEAMACGAAVVASDVSGNQGVISDEETGILCSTEPSGIRSALERMLESSELRSRLGDAARHYATEHLSVSVVAEREWGIYQEIIQGSVQ